MKQVIAFLKPGDAFADHPQMEWWYFTGFDYEYSSSYAHDMNEVILMSKRLSDAHVFNEDQHATLRAAAMRIRRNHRIVPQMFSISDKRLFEARLKDE